MSKALFPILEVQGNRITSIDGNVGHLYQLGGVDLEQMAPFEIESFYEGLSTSLSNLDSKGYFKFYQLGGKAYFETQEKSTSSFSALSPLPCDRPLEVFFGAREIISDLAFYDDYLSFNGQYIRLFSCLGFSESPAHERFLPEDVDYVISFRRIPKDKSVNRLERIRSGHLSSFFKNKRDIASEGTYAQAEELIFDLVRGQEALFEMELFFLLRTSSLEELNSQSELLQSELAASGIKIFAEGQSLVKLKSGLPSIFNELIPGVSPKLGLRKLPNKSSHLRYLLPVNHSSLMDSGVRFEDIGDREIFFNPFSEDLKNRNMLVTGTSGAGKSVFVNKLVHNLIDRHPTVIIDKGGSFGKLTKYHGGKTLNAGINPLQFKDPLFLREFILSVVDAKRFGKLEKGKLLKSIKNSLGAFKNFKGLISALCEDFSGLDLYFEELWDFFNDDEVEQVPILYVDVEEFPKGVIAPLIIYLLEYFKRLPQKEKILVFDECWSFLAEHASYIDECFRTFRKNGAFPIAISQSLNDFSSAGEGLASSITNNSYFKVFFPQELNADNEISEFDISRIQSLRLEKGNYSECYLKSADNRYRKIIRNYLGPLELELFHTEAGKDKSLYRFIEQFDEFFETKAQTIEAYVRLKHETNNDFYIGGLHV